MLPYIKPERRKLYDAQIDELIKTMQNQFLSGNDKTPLNAGADINYIVTRLLKAMFAEGPYFMRAEGIKTLECAKLEYYRRYMAEYENSKIEENGDIEA